MNADRDDDLRKAFADLRADDAEQLPPFAQVTRAVAPAPRHKPWLRLALLPAAVVLAVVVLRHNTQVPLPDASVVRMAGAWRGPTDFLSDAVGTGLLRTTSPLPDLRLRLQLGPRASTEHDS